MKKFAFALIALLCLAVFTLPEGAEAKSPPGAVQVSRDYQENITINTVVDADIGAQHIGVSGTDGSMNQYDHSMAVERAARTTNPRSHSHAVLPSPHEGYDLASGRTATNERPVQIDNPLNNYMGATREASRYSERK